MTTILLSANFSLLSQTAEEWKKLGNNELDNANYSKAIDFYQKSIEIDSNYYDAYYNLGYAFFLNDDFDKAIEYLNKAITKNDTDANAFFLLGGIYIEKENYDRSIELFKEGIRLEPDSPDELYLLSMLYEETGNSTYAMSYAKKAAKLGNEDAQDLFFSRGMTWEDNFVKPDYEQIKLNIENEQSDLYYSKLWDRHQQGDSTMSIEENRHLYYGYIFSENYAPYVTAHDTEKANAILRKENPTQKEWEELVAIFNISLSKEPFCCRHLYYQGVAYHALSKPEEAERNFKKINHITSALYSTGDGLSKETAMHVTAVHNEYDYLFINRLSLKEQFLADRRYDVLKLAPNEEGLEEIWFDISQALNSLDWSSE